MAMYKEPTYETMISVRDNISKYFKTNYFSFV